MTPPTIPNMANELSKLEKLYITLFTLNELKIRPNKKLLTAISKEEKLLEEGVVDDDDDDVEIELDDTKAAVTRSHLNVIDDSGNMLSSTNNKKSFLFVLKLIGIERLPSLGIMCGMNEFASLNPPKKKKYKRISGVYIRKVISAKSMKVVLDEINEKLNLNWKIFIT